jgi:hypothetical protein
MSNLPDLGAGRRSSSSVKRLAVLRTVDLGSVAMRLRSAVDGLDQIEPVTTAYDAEGGRPAIAEADWDQAEDLHVFCTERAFERISAAGARDDWPKVDENCRSLGVLDVLVADGKRRPQLRTAVLEYLCAQAKEDEDHEDFRAGWALSPCRSRLRLV